MSKVWGQEIATNWAKTDHKYMMPLIYFVLIILQ